ncbi:unnamed protein product [Penicillium salamii]|nr:unnamed protein product [Penicillium salamii]
MLRGGWDHQRKLPDPKTVGLPRLVPKSRPGRVEETLMPAVTPSTLLITKTKRWFFVDEPSRPLSQRKAARDLEDIKVLLEWLSSKV